MSALQNIRKGLSSTGSSIIVAILIFGLVATFGGFLTDPSSPSNSPLKINGKNISFGEYNLEFSRLSTLFSDGDISEELINEITRNSIISKELVYQKALDLQMNVSDEFVNSLIANDTSFQTNGEFDTSLFSGYMARLGFTVNDYRELVKSKYLANSLSDFISRSEFTLDSSALNFIQATNQQRSLSFFKLDLTEIAEKEKIQDSEILNYYQQNQFKFIEPKKLAINYILLDENMYMDSLEVSTQEIQDERNLMEEGNDNSQTRVSHIQLSFSSDEEKEEKLNTANTILEKLSDSITFESLVEEYSDDFGSNSNGGDLGYTDGTILPDEFESEIKNLSINEISQIIEMPGSIHILKVTEKNEFLFTDAEIREMILSDKSQEILNQTLLNIEDNYLGLTLDFLASDLNIKIQKSKQFDEDNFPEELLSFNVSNEIFNQNDVSTEFFGPYEDEKGRFLIFEVREVKQETLLSQSAAEPEIKKILQLDQAQDTILQELEKYEAKANDNDLSEFNSYSLIKRDSSLLPDNLLSDLFTVNFDKPVFISSQENGDFYVVRLTKVKNSKNLAKKEDIEAAKNSMKALNSRSYFDTFFRELESSSYIN
jgi:parvulin-like peptidyl-prolyl isomerase